MNSLFSKSSQKFYQTPPRCRASIRTLSGLLVSPVHVGVRFNPRSPHSCDGPGDCWGCYLSGGLLDQHSNRSHPNKAADVVFAKLPE